MSSKSSPQKTEYTAQSKELSSRNIQLGRVSHQPWRKQLHFVSPSYRAKAFWGVAGIGCLIFLWSVFQAFLAADLAALTTLNKLSFNYSMVFTIVIGLLLAGLCVVISFQGMSLKVVKGNRDIQLELRQSFNTPQVFLFSNYKFARIISNENSEARAFTPQRNYPNALKNNSHTAVISFVGTTLSLESQDLAALESLKVMLDEHKLIENKALD